MKELNPHMLIGLGQAIEKWQNALQEIKRIKSKSELWDLVGRLRKSCGLCDYEKTTQEKDSTLDVTKGYDFICAGCPYVNVYHTICTNDEFFKILSYVALYDLGHKERYKRVKRSIQLCIIKLLLIKKHFGLRTSDDRATIASLEIFNTKE